jgi:hypothetical protein
MSSAIKKELGTVVMIKKPKISTFFKLFNWNKWECIYKIDVTSEQLIHEQNIEKRC